MKIYTRIVFDWDGNVLESDWFEYDGPLELCDRSVQAQAGQQATGAEGTAGQYGSEAGGIFGSLYPTLAARARGETPGFGALGLGSMLTSAEAGSAGARSTAEEQARLRGARTGNLASIAPTTAAAAGEAGRAGGSTVQDILAKNAMLKEQQQSSALGELGGMFGTAGKLQEGAMGIANEDLETKLKAGQSGWLQNMEGILASLRGAGGSTASGASLFL